MQKTRTTAGPHGSCSIQPTNCSIDVYKRQMQRTGEPGSSAEFWIRGQSTFGAKTTAPPVCQIRRDQHCQISCCRTQGDGDACAGQLRRRAYHVTLPRPEAQSARRFPPRQAPGRSGGQFSFPRLRPASPSDILRHNKASMFSTHVLMSGITWRFLRQIDKKKSYISASFIRSKYSF